MASFNFVRKLSWKRRSQSDINQVKPNTLGERSVSEAVIPQQEHASTYMEHRPQTTNETATVVKRKNLTKQLEMMPDKALEEEVLTTHLEFVVNNLPPEDVALLMYDKQLLTKSEYEEFQRMKKIYIPTRDKSEHLLESLARREGGFLEKLCTILDSIPPSKHIAARLREGYKDALIKRGKTPSAEGIGLAAQNRWSKVSMSDPDIRIKDSAQQCTQCKLLELRNKRLKKCLKMMQVQFEQKESECLLLQQSKTKVETLVEVGLKQVQHCEQENAKLRALLPQLQKAVSLVESRSGESGLHSTIQQMNEYLHQEQRNNKQESTISQTMALRRLSGHGSSRDISRDSFLSMLSDMSEEELGSLKHATLFQRSNSTAESGASDTAIRDVPWVKDNPSRVHTSGTLADEQRSDVQSRFTTPTANLEPPTPPPKHKHNDKDLNTFQMQGSIRHCFVRHNTDPNQFNSVKLAPVHLRSSSTPQRLTNKLEGGDASNDNRSVNSSPHAYYTVHTTVGHNYSSSRANKELESILKVRRKHVEESHSSSLTQ